MSIEIEKNIPIPLADGRETDFSRAVKEMGVGDSFILPQNKKVEVARANLSELSKKIGKKFAVRKCGGGYRIWRIS